MKQRIDDFSSTKTPPGVSGASMNQEFFIEFESIELGCDHQLLKELETKNHKKVEENPQWLSKNVDFYLLSFLLLAPSKVDGRS